MQNIGLGLLEALVLFSVSISVACLIAALGGFVRYTTRNTEVDTGVSWLIRLGIFIGVPFSIMGMTSGYLTGLSRVGAVSSLVPAGLTLLGGIAAYLFNKGPRSGLLATFAVINFSTMSMVGGLIGGRERVQTEQAESSLDAKRDKVRIEFLVERYRHSLGLPPSNPTPTKADPDPKDAD
jgi:hypothetical protein